MLTLPLPDSQPRTARLAAAGSRRAEMEALLAAAPPSACLPEYADLVLNRNVGGKASAVSRTKLLAQLRARYILDPRVPEFVAFRAGMAAEFASVERGLLCYLMMARCDRVFREVSLLLLSSQRGDVDSRIFAAALQDYLQTAGLAWSRETTKHSRQHTLSSLKDFGVLAGSRNKRILPQRPGAGVMLFAARLATLEGLTGRQALSCRWFRLLGLELDQTIERLRAAQRVGLLSFRMQAQVVELTLPSLESSAMENI